MSKKDYISNIEGAERRFVATSVSYEKREDGESGVIEGYAALYNKRADLGWFHEEILPGAFDNVLNDDVRCLFNHDPSLILARSTNGKGTLSISTDEKGLKFRYETPNISYAKDLEESINRGDVSQCSFGFQTEEVIWIEREGEPELRQIKKFSRLYDVSPVTYPAYEDTTVAKRSLEAFKKDNTPPPADDNKIAEYEARYKFNLNNAKR